MRTLTEREIIRIFARQFDGGPRMPLGYNDDVSAVPVSSETWIIAKTDMLVGSTDVPPRMTLRQAARKAVVATISDFSAKSVRPLALMASVGLTSPTEKSVRDIARGLDSAAREYNCRIIGGDTSQANDLAIDVVGIGLANPKKLIRRDGARPGDTVAVTGSFGKSAAGLKILMSKRKSGVDKYRSLVNAILLPKARLKEGTLLAKIGGVTSSIDSSDGLAWSLHQIARASRVGIHLHTIPVAPEVYRFAKESQSSATELALYGGEEYELVLTVRPERFNELRRHVYSLRSVGTVQRRDFGVSAQIAGREVVLEAQGWEHFT